MPTPITTFCDRYAAALRARGIDIWYDRENDGREHVHFTGDRVLRGGSWGFDSQDARVAFRYHAGVVYFGGLGGFRLARAAAGSV